MRRQRNNRDRFQATLVALALAAPAPAAVLGVPASPGAAPAAWFLLVGRDSIATDQANYLGDLARELTVHVEVTAPQLRVCLYDPGLFDPEMDPGVAQLDFRFAPAPPGCPPTVMVFELYAPGNPIPIARDDTTFGPDEPGNGGSNRRPWCFFDSASDVPVEPGTYRLVVRMDDGPCADEDVNVFGLQTFPDYDAYVYHATLGHSRHSGADVSSGGARLYPWVAAGSAGRDPDDAPVCGLDVTTFDLDAPAAGAAPPELIFTTALGWSDLLTPSVDGGFHTERWPNMAGYGFGDDHGIYSLEVNGSTAAAGVVEAHGSPAPCVPQACPAGGLDFNAFSLQVYDYGHPPPVAFSDYPVAPPDPRAEAFRPRRLYLPRAGDAAPVKEHVGHFLIDPAGGEFVAGSTTTVTVELAVANPTAYELSNVRGATTVNGAAGASPPRLLQVPPGGDATVTDRTIDFSLASVPARSTAVLRYQVDYTPVASGELFLTGDGSGFAGGSAPTWVTWDTVFQSGERAAPCALLALVDPIPCQATAVPSAPAGACRNQDFVLDASGSSAVACSALEYAWTGPGLPPFPLFGAEPALTVSSPTAGSRTYTLDVRCFEDLTCNDRVDVTVAVSPGEAATAAAGRDRSIATCDLPLPIGSPGDVSRFTYAWSPASLVADPAAPETLLVAPGPGRRDLTLTVTSRLDPGCSASDELSVLVSEGSPEGALGNTLVAVRAGTGTQLGWPTGLLTQDRYNVHRSDSRLDLEPADYRAPLLNGAVVTAGAYLDETPAPGTVTFYQVWGRDCSGSSVLR